jgi:hypothetical protein
VVIPQVLVFRENIRRVRIIVTDPSVPVSEPQAVFSALKIMPNPSFDDAELSVFSPQEMDVDLGVAALDGTKVSIRNHLFEGENRLALTAFEKLPTGFYFITISGNGLQQVVKWVKM